MVLLSFTLAACGGGGGGGSSGGAPSAEPTGRIGLRELRVSVDGAPARVYTNFEQPTQVVDAGIAVASSRLVFEVAVDDPGQAVTCSIAGHDLAHGAEGRLVGELRAAYLNEQLDLACTAAGATTLHHSVVLEAADPQLQGALEWFLTKWVPKKNGRFPEDPFSGHRVDSYYAEFQRFLMAAEVYADPEAFGVDPQGEVRRTLEDYLINTSESYFEPCVNYDFVTGPLSQCRSPARVGKYYLWRSPLNEGSPIGTAHPMAEWRAGAGIAQAAKALLLEHAADDTRGCPVSDEPSRISSAPLICRALNVRRLLFQEVWRKWRDEDWVAGLGYAHQSTIQGTDVSHWISWTEFMVDLFQSTASIGAGPDCSYCAQMREVPSSMDRLLEFFWEWGDGNVAVSCRPTHMSTGCDFEGTDLQVARSSDLSHQASVIQLVTAGDADEVCSSDRRHCVTIRALAATMRREAWVDWIANDGGTRGFPKFDVFLNGYCSGAVSRPADPLGKFCERYWLRETGGCLLHRNLFGFVNLGRYDRELMLRLREAADENHDGILDAKDTYLQTFSVMLYKAIASGPN
jgi:hypothetical protein